MYPFYFLPISISLLVFLSYTQAYQDDDPRKYSLATVLVQVLAVNQFYPEFAMAEYQGFVTAGKSPASLVNTYGSKVLVLHVHDQDFNHVCTPLHSTHIKDDQSSSAFVFYIVTHHLLFSGFQSHDPLHPQSYIQSYRHLPNYTGGSSDHQD